MTAEVFTAVVRPASGFSTARKSGGSAAATGADFAAVASVNDALELCSDAWKAEHVVGPNKMGKASSVLA